MEGYGNVCNGTVYNTENLLGGELLNRVAQVLDKNHEVQECEFNDTKRFLIDVTRDMTDKRNSVATYFNIGCRGAKKKVENQFRASVSGSRDFRSLRQALEEYCQGIARLNTNLSGYTFRFQHEVSTALRMTDENFKVFHFDANQLQMRMRQKPQQDPLLYAQENLVRANENDAYRRFCWGNQSRTTYGGIYSCKSKSGANRTIFYDYGCLAVTSDSELKTGYFRNGELCGCGETAKSDNQYQIGAFNNGRLHGYGREEQPDGLFQQGEFKKGQLDGRGLRKTAGGKTETGRFKNGVLYQGRITDEYGDSYEGRFNEQGKLTGQGKIIRANGLTEEGKFVKGEKHGNFNFADNNNYNYTATYVRGVLDGRVKCEETGKLGQFNVKDEFVADDDTQL